MPRPKRKLRKLKKIIRSLYPKLVPDIGITIERKGQVKLPLQGYCQTDPYRCGISAGWSVLTYLNEKANLAKFEQTCKPSKEIGTQSGNLRKALRAQGITTKTVKLTFPVIKKAIKAGYPILTTIYLRKDIYHWIAIYGFQYRPQKVFFVGRIVPGFSSKSLTWGELKRKSGPWLSIVARRRRVRPKRTGSAYTYSRSSSVWF